MACKIKTHNGYCDFCKKHQGKFWGDDNGGDICFDCVKEAWNVNPNKSLITNAISMSNALMKRLLDADTQKLIKAEYLNNDLSLTSLGQETILAIMLEQNRDALVKDAEERIAEKKDEKK